MSVSDFELVAEVRRMAEVDLMTSREVAAHFEVTHNAVISLARRVDPRIKWHPGNCGRAFRAYNDKVRKGEIEHPLRARKKLERRQRDEAIKALRPTVSTGQGDRGGASLSTRHMRLKNKVCGEQPPVKMRPVVMLRHNYQPRCCWAGCDAAPMSPGKPYCSAHHFQSGALVSAQPMAGARSK